MLTVEFDRRLPVTAGQTVLDLGCGGGRHAFEAYRRGANVVALDRDAQELAGVAVMFAAMAAEGEAPRGAWAQAVEGDALNLPFDDDTFDVVIASEILEHIPDDLAAIAELTRVARPGGTVAVTVPRFGPEAICWALSHAYHDNEGGHVRIYGRSQLLERLEAAGLELLGTHHAHALHSPYWWAKCAVGVDNDESWLPREYHRLLVWDLMRRPWITRTLERLLDPVIGKSFVAYLRKPEAARAAA